MIDWIQSGSKAYGFESSSSSSSSGFAGVFCANGF